MHEMDEVQSNDCINDYAVIRMPRTPDFRTTF